MIGKTAGHYRITAKLARGARGKFFLAEDTRLERKAAIWSCQPKWPRTRSGTSVF